MVRKMPGQEEKEWLKSSSENHLLLTKSSSFTSDHFTSQLVDLAPRPPGKHNKLASLSPLSDGELNRSMSPHTVRYQSHARHTMILCGQKEFRAYESVVLKRKLVIDCLYTRSKLRCQF